MNQEPSLSLTPEHSPLDLAGEERSPYSALTLKCILHVDSDPLVIATSVRFS